MLYGSEIAMTALAHAVHERRWRQARLLIEIGCSVNGKNAQGRTSLIEMCFVDNQDTAAGLTRVLLEKGADIDAIDNDGRTALSNACLLHRTKLFSLLIKYIDYDLNSADKDGNTALFHAITAGDVLVVKELIAKMLHFGLKVDILNAKGETPLIYALKSKKLEIADVLINEGKASLEARDLEFQKSASQWRDDLTRTSSNNGYFPLLFSIKTQEERKMQSQTKVKTGSARQQQRVQSLPVLITRPATAPDRIVVLDFLRPCVPIKTNLDKLYSIYNQQTTDSFRRGYKTIKYKEPKTEEHRPSKVSFNQVNELTIKLQGLYKEAVKRKGTVSARSKSPCRVGSGDRPTSRSVAKGTKVLKNLNKTMQQFESSKMNDKEVQILTE